jgi:hypothetical protein
MSDDDLERRKFIEQAAEDEPVGMVKVSSVKPSGAPDRTG